jgi:hypothetical protein
MPALLQAHENWKQAQAGQQGTDLLALQTATAVSDDRLVSKLVHPDAQMDHEIQIQKG